MKTEDQIIALLEWMGWRAIRHQLYWEGRLVDTRGGRLYGAVPKLPGTDGIPVEEWNESHRAECPPLTLDLMHEAVARLGQLKQQHVSYAYKLEELVSYDEIGQVGHILALSQATKEKRLEALLKTIGKWVEEPTASSPPPQS